MSYLQLPLRSKNKAKKIGLVLSGGGAKSMIYIGIYEVFIKEKIPIDVVTGSSFGACLGPLIAMGCTPDEMVDFMLQLSKQKISGLQHFNYFQESIFTNDALRLPFQAFLKKRKITNIEQLNIPYGCNAINLETGKETNFTSGSILFSTLASGSLPLIYPPVYYNKSYYIDGGMLNNAPAILAKKLGAKKLIVFNIKSFVRRQKIAAQIFKNHIQNSKIEFQDIIHKNNKNYVVNVKNDLKYFLEFAFEIIRISAENVTTDNINRSCAELVFEPEVNMDSLDISLQSIEKCLDIGRKFAKQNLHKIKKLVQED